MDSPVSFSLPEDNEGPGYYYFDRALAKPPSRENRDRSVEKRRGKTSLTA